MSSKTDGTDAIENGDSAIERVSVLPTRQSEKSSHAQAKNSAKIAREKLNL